jgi:translocation and assembly module TamB
MPSGRGRGSPALKGTLDLGLSPEDPFEIRLDGTRLIAGDMTWETLSVRGAGRIPDHRLELSLKGEPVSVTFEGSGGLARDGAYSGRIARLDLETTTFGDWALRQPSPVSIAGPKIAFGPFCIRGPNGSGGCAELSGARPSVRSRAWTSRWPILHSSGP